MVNLHARHPHPNPANHNNYHYRRQFNDEEPQPSGDVVFSDTASNTRSLEIGTATGGGPALPPIFTPDAPPSSTPRPTFSPTPTPSESSAPTPTSAPASGQLSTTTIVVIVVSIFASLALVLLGILWIGVRKRRAAAASGAGSPRGADKRGAAAAGSNKEWTEMSTSSSNGGGAVGYSYAYGGDQRSQSGHGHGGSATRVGGSGYDNRPRASSDAARSYASHAPLVVPAVPALKTSASNAHLLAPPQDEESFLSLKSSHSVALQDAMDRDTNRDTYTSEPSIYRDSTSYPPAPLGSTQPLNVANKGPNQNLGAIGFDSSNNNTHSFTSYSSSTANRPTDLASLAEAAGLGPLASSTPARSSPLNPAVSNLRVEVASPSRLSFGEAPNLDLSLGVPGAGGGKGGYDTPSVYSNVGSSSAPPLGSNNPFATPPQSSRVSLADQNPFNTPSGSNNPYLKSSSASTASLNEKKRNTLHKQPSQASLAKREKEGSMMAMQNLIQALDMSQQGEGRESKLPDAQVFRAALGSDKNRRSSLDSL